MTNCTCGVTTCTYNDASCCCKSEILVDGTAAKDCEETCCASFYERGEGSWKNQAEQTPHERLSIQCNAQNCYYNSNHRCSADHVSIGGNGALDARHTECATFRER